VAGNGSGRIAFVKTNPAEEIYVMEADGSKQTRLTTNDDPDYDPAWSPDGSRIAFESNRHVGHDAIYVMNADGSHQRPLTTSHIFNESMNYMPAWSPNRRSSP
jgi:Tol biopolymer transport system component